MKAALSAPVPLSAAHDLSEFECGVDTLNVWLRKRASANEVNGASRTYVACNVNKPVGYYCLAAGSVAHVEIAKPLRRNMPDPVPVAVLGRLAVDVEYQKQGLGRSLLNDAVGRVLQLAGQIGITGILVHALSEDARVFYLANGFLDSEFQPMTLCLPLSSFRRLVH